MENLTEQIEEIEALSAIYGDDFLVIDEANRIYEIRVSNENDSWWSATLQFLLPPQYPAKVPPVFEIYSAWMNEADMFEASDMLHTISREHQGEIVLYHWVEALRTFIDEKFTDSQNKVDEQSNVDQIIETDKDENIPTGEEVTDAQEDETLFEESKKSDYSKSEVDTLKLIKSAKLDEKPQIIHGEPFTDRKSTFQAHLAHVVTQDQVRQVLEELKENRKINNATHNVMAYRIFIDDRNSYLHDCDDDGEAMAGSRLLHLLQILNVKNIVVIVTRWYGGILLGPDRFKHYNNCARDIMKVAGLVESSSDLKDSKSKGRFKVCKKH
ncbi:unnamed protein product [Porites lobata]|uniref:RWD domain-containing protein n=1 Tax=Porites lobata TaxID=104759 RepID=A0ABN8Q142_9CNID|nr:unnamed protein product [Porites lobata]